MALDPRNYDLEELRGVSRPDPEGPTVASGVVDGESEFVWGQTVPAHRRRPLGSPRPQSTRPELLLEGVQPAAAERFEARLFRDLAAIDVQVPDTRPYVAALPASLTAELVAVDWMDYLVRQAGRTEAGEAIDFYASVGWLSDAAATELRGYLSGVDGARSNTADRLDADDHRVSLHYVARLAWLSRD